MSTLCYLLDPPLRLHERDWRENPNGNNTYFGYEESCTLPEGLNNFLEDVEAYVSRVVHQTQLSNLRVGVVNGREERKNERVECVRAQPV